MNKIVNLIALIALTATFSFAGSTFSYGVKTGLGFNMFKVDDHLVKIIKSGKDNDGRTKPVDPGIGPSIHLGAAFNIPIIKGLSFNPELNFMYRSLWWYDNRIEGKDCPATENMIKGMGSNPMVPPMVAGMVQGLVDEGLMGCNFHYLEYEFVISVPLMLKYVFTQNFPIFVATGVQFDFPLWLQETRFGYGDPKSFDVEDRSIVDIGIPVSIGYDITDKVSFDFRMVIGLTKAFDREATDTTTEDNRSFNQFALGLTFMIP